MKNKQLSQWLQDHSEMLGSIGDQEDQAFHLALYEGIIDATRHGETVMIDSVLESAAAHAVATGRKLTDLLGVPHRLRQRIWQRVGDEIDPEPAFVMLSALDALFVHIMQVTIDAYLIGTNLAHAAKSTEISRLYTDSEKKVMEYTAEVARANRELARLEQAKTDFIGIAAHELKTPLTLIQGYINILRDEATGVQVESTVEGISRGAARMNSIIEDMLDLSEIDLKQLKLVLEDVKLEKTIGLVVNQLNRAIVEREQSVRTVALDTLPIVQADARRLHQIFRQIVNNAIKYTPDGGQITITGHQLKSAENGVDWVRIMITDTGVGIAPEDRDRIFEKFYRVGDTSLHSSGQTKFMGAGPGLGLAIVKGLIEAHGGQVTAESPGFDRENYPGASFQITLPLKAQPPSGINVEWMSPG
jgi:signal transduction histidine kinase